MLKSQSKQLTNMEMSKNKIIITVVLIAVVVGVLFYYFSKSKDSSSGSSATSSTTTNSSNTVNNSCVRNFDENKLANDKLSFSNKMVELDVANFGKIKVELYDKDAPKTVENFLRLTNSGFYDCLTFHRIAKGFVIQGGDPRGDGTGGLSAFGGEFEDELNPDTPSFKEGYKRGVLAMANHGKNTNSSQFFIMTSDYPLEHNYTIFGKVVEGMDVVDKIAAVEIVPSSPLQPDDGNPKEKVVITKATIIN